MMDGTSTPTAGNRALDMVAAQARVEEIVRASGTSFYWAMRFLPEAKRNAMFAIYAFCRVVDDIADEPAPLAEKIAELKRWRGEIDLLYAGTPSDVVAQGLLAHLEEFQLYREDFLGVIDGMEMDAAETMAIQDMAELELYCDRVACAVGRLCCSVFGLDRERSVELSAALGQALQLTNILRDVAEDAARDRLYIPLEKLKEHGITAETPTGVLADATLPQVLEDLSTLAGQRFEEAARILKQCDRQSVRPATIMMAVYRRTYDAMVARGWTRFREPVGPSKAMKLLLALRHGLF